MTLLPGIWIHPPPENTDTDVDKYLRLAVLLDRDVGRLIRALIIHAATVAEDREAEWIQLLRNINQDPLLLIRDLSTLTDDTEDNDPKADRLAAARLASTVRALLAPLADEAPSQSTSRSRRLRARRGGRLKHPRAAGPPIRPDPPNATATNRF